MRRVRALAALAAVTLVISCGPDPAREPAQPSESASVAAPEFGWTITKETVGLASIGLDCAQLVPYSGPAAVPAGTTISERRITRSLDLSAGDIAIERSCIQPTSVGSGMPAVTTTDLNTLRVVEAVVTIRDSDFDGGLLSPEEAGMSTAFVGIANLHNNYIHHFGTGISLMGTGTVLDAAIEHNYVTDLVAWGDASKDGNHSDGLTVREFDARQRPERQALIKNNRFDCDSGNDTGAVFIQTYSGPIDNVTLEGNLLEGGGYQLGLNETNHPYSGLSAVNNRFSGTGYGPAYVQGGGGWDEWEENYLFDPDSPSARSEMVSRP